jgi:hypothetical protein
VSDHFADTNGKDLPRSKGTVPWRIDIGIRALVRPESGKPALNDWLLRYARQAQSSGSAKTLVVADDDRFVGYFSLTVGQADSLGVPERILKGMAQYAVPVVILSRLTVSSI